MRIALDFDKTYTADPPAWDAFISLMRERGHEVVIVTHRSPDLDRTADILALEAGRYKGGPVKVYYTNGVAKLWWMTHFGDGAPDIWIDDNPSAIFHNSPTAPAALATWRAERDNPKG